MALLDVFRRSPAPTVRPAMNLTELLDATLSSSEVSPELHNNASFLRSQIMLDAHVKSDPLFQGLSALQGTINNAMSSRSAQIGVNEFGALGRRQYVSDRRRLLELYRVVEQCSEIQTAITNLRNEIFRRGMEWKPAFDFKCPECKKTYNKAEAKTAHYKCDCLSDLKDVGLLPEQFKDGVPLVEPDPEEITKFNKLFKKANYFGQTLESVLRSCERDINVVDDAFLMFSKTYEITDAQEEIARNNPFDHRAKPTETLTDIVRLDPTLIQFDLNDRGVPGRAHHICLFHRATLLDIPQDENWDTDWRGICPQCGLRTYAVWFTFNEQASAPYSASRPVTIYLLEEEVCHWSRYSPTESYGWPPVFAIYEKALTLLGMDRFVYDYFFERRIPQGVVAVATSDTDDLRLQKLQTEAEMMRNPHYIPWIAIDNRNGQATMQYIRFGYTLDEIDYLPLRDEIRERIAALYGVSALWMGSTSSSGGLNSESQQIVVQSRVVEAAQRSYHIDVFGKLEHAMGVHDWHLELRTPEEANELATWEIKQAKATWATMMIQSGFGAEYEQETDTWTISGRVLSQQEQMEQQTAQSLIGNGGSLMPPPDGGAPPPPGGPPADGEPPKGPKATPPPSDARAPDNQVLDSKLHTNGHRRMPSGGLQPLEMPGH